MRLAGHTLKQRPADAPSAVGGFHEQVLQVDAGLREKRRKGLEEKRESHGVTVDIRE